MPKINIDKVSKDTLSREVFNLSEIEAKTELTITQIEAVSKLKTYSKITGLSLLDVHINNLLILNKSKDRASMKEFITSLRSIKEETLQKSGNNFKLLG